MPAIETSIKYLKIVFTCIFVTLFCNAKGQDTDYSKYINDRLINKKQIVKTPGVKEEIVYLGKIKNSKGQVKFYILSLFTEVQAAIALHGHSNVLYLDNAKILKKQFELGTSDDLPFQLKNNSLYFHFYNYKTKKKELYINQVGIEIPTLLCVAPHDCY